MMTKETPKKHPPQTLLTIPEAAEYLRLTEKALRQVIHRGDGPPLIRLGVRTIRILSSDLETWVMERKASSS
jgi:excisionase family DNA binding protein